MELRATSCIVLILALCVLSCTATEEKGKRKGKLFPVFQVVQFENDACAGGSRNGTCFTAAECTAKSGTSSGTCASGYGVCCVFTLACGATSSQNCTYLVQASTTKPATSACTYKICKCSTNICRIRLDFTTFQIAGPQTGTTVDGTTTAVTTNGGGIGDCTTDRFSVTSPGNAGTPQICGYNTGQHMYVDASDACNLVNFDIGSSGDTRQWDIKVTQYACGDTQAGPDGCLQYFTGTSGRVSSFNFPTASSTVAATTTHLSNQCYTMCFRQEAGKCSICFTTSITNTGANTAAIQSSFGLSNPTSTTIAQSVTGTSCISDFLVIPNAQTSPGAANVNGVERLCGRIFLASNGLTTTGTSICSFETPFRMTFKTDANEVTTGTDPSVNEQALSPGGIVGFSLNYVEQSC